MLVKETMTTILAALNEKPEMLEHFLNLAYRIGKVDGYLSAVTENETKPGAKDGK